MLRASSWPSPRSITAADLSPGSWGFLLFAEYAATGTPWSGGVIVRLARFTSPIAKRIWSQLHVPPLHAKSGRTASRGRRREPTDTHVRPVRESVGFVSEHIAPLICISWPKISYEEESQCV